MLSLGELQIICGLAKGRTQTEIGEKLHLEQSTISKMLRACEERLGVEIVMLNGRRLGLSPAGRTLALAAQRALDAFDDLETFIDELRVGQAGLVRFAASSTPGSYVVPPLVARFLRERPDVSIDLQIYPASALWERFDSERFDFAVAPALGLPAELIAEPLYDDSLVFFASPNAPIIGRVGLTLGELAGETLIGKFVDSHWRGIFRELERGGFRAEKRITVIPPEGVKRMVAQGLGIGALLESSIARELEEGSLVRLPISDPSLTQQFCLATRRGDVLSPPAAALVGLLRTALSHGPLEYRPARLDL
jgi:DNA-binding transcriptional LysR family regulator